MLFCAIIGGMGNKKKEAPTPDPYVGARIRLSRRRGVKMLAAASDRDMQEVLDEAVDEYLIRMHAAK